MSHWLDRVLNLLESKTDDLRQLAEIAGADPKTFYLGTDMTGVNICGQDLRGMEFTNLNLEVVEWDGNTIIENEDYGLDIAESQYFIDQEIRRIKKIRYQEERFPALVCLYSENIDLMDYISESYRDRSFTINYNISEFINEIKKGKILFGEYDINLLIEIVIKNVLRSPKSFSKNELIKNVAKYMSRKDNIASLLMSNINYSIYDKETVAYVKACLRNRNPEA